MKKRRKWCASAVDEQALQWPEEALRAAGDVREAHEAVRERRARHAPLELLGGERPPDVVDECRRIAGQRPDGAIEVLGPEPQPRLAGQLGVVTDDVHLGVV